MCHMGTFFSLQPVFIFLLLCGVQFKLGKNRTSFCTAYKVSPCVGTLALVQGLHVSQLGYTNIPEDDFFI